MIFDNWADVCLAKKKNVGVTQLAASLWGQPIWMLHFNLYIIVEVLQRQKQIVIYYIKKFFKESQ